MTLSPYDKLQQMVGDEMLIFGHRGAKAYAPMNTLPAFRLAAEQGAHGIELDVQLSKDEEPVVIHDSTVDATTDGSGEVSEMTLAQLQALDAGRWFDEQYAGTRIPTLAEVFDAVGQQLYINIELKTLLPSNEPLVQAVAARIRRYAMTERVLVSSFNPLALKQFKNAAPEIPLGFLYMTLTKPLQMMLSAEDYHAVHPQQELIDAGLMHKAAERRHRVNAWTVNDVARARELQALGVSILITDTPDIIIEGLA